ncbi:MAG: FtsX-like permease family protein [Planctomycetota bacterium]
MRLPAIALRNLRVRVLSSSLTAFSVALGTGMIAAIWLLLVQVQSRYQSSIAGYDAVVGPKQGSSLQLFMSTVLNLEDAQGVLPLSVYTELHDGARARSRYGLRYAIPQARGDTVGGFPLIGTTDEMFSAFTRGKDENDQRRHLVLERGETWSFSHADLLAVAEELAKEMNEPHADHADHGSHPGEEDHDHHEIRKEWCRAVIGAQVARSLGLDVGSTFVPVHGKSEAGAHEHEEARTTVVGVLAPTYTPIDRSIYVPIGLQLSLPQHNAIQLAPDANPVTTEVGAKDVQISSIVVGALGHLADQNLRYDFQTRADAQVASPKLEIIKLLSLVGDAAGILRIVAWLVIVVAAAGVLVALYNTMNERRREIAIMRALGARRLQIFAIIVLEAAVVAGLGAVGGVLLAHGSAILFGPAIQARVNVPIDPGAFSIDEVWLILAVTALGALAGFIPAVKGSTTEVAEHLGPTS